MFVYEMARANLSEFIADLYIEYGQAKPTTQGGAVSVVVIDENTTEPAARQKMTQFLSKHELSPLSIIILPGPDVRTKINRRVTVLVRRDAVIQRGGWL